MHRYLALLLLAGVLVAADGGSPDAAKAGMDPARIARIPARMQAFVDQGKAAGIVTLLARHGQLALHSAVGWRDREARDPMRTDTIFQIMSMTKPVTAIGILLLMEEGLLTLSDPVEKHLPEFRGQMLSDHGVLSKPSRRITIRDLLTHSSGMAGSWGPGLSESARKRDRTLAEMISIQSQQPLQFEPGTRWSYSNTGIATLGRIIEVVSGKPYDRFLAERIFAPLGMEDTFFFPPEEKHSRIAAVYTDDNGTLKRADVDLYRKGSRYAAPEGGLFSTAADMARLYQMLLGRGSLEGRRFLSPASIEVLTGNHTGDLTAGFAPGQGYGLGVAVVRNADGEFRLNSIGAFGHGGAFRTYGWMDPSKDLLGVIMYQRTNGGGDVADEISTFMAMAAAAIVPAHE